jgi:molybdenum cofactor cytidylyltransferase
MAAMKAKAHTGPPVAAVVLAAGGSARMGQPKQLLPVGGQPMVRRVAEAACGAGLGQVVVVVGAHAGAVRDALAGLLVEVVANEDWAMGMSSSLRAGLRALRPEIEAALLVLGDQPALTSGLLAALVTHFHETGAPIVAPVYAGRRGNPVLFHRSLFAELLAVEGDQGGRALLDRHREKVELLAVDDPAVVLDIDTRHDYAQIQEMERP